MRATLSRILAFLFLLPALCNRTAAQVPADREPLRINLNSDGSQFFAATFMNQAWVRYNAHNPGTLVEGRPQADGVDIGLRRTRIQLYGQLTDRVFLYFQFGMNNFNAQYAVGGNRKLAAFFHDAVCEYRATSNNALKLGAGLTIANGLSRFSQPGISSILTMDVPVFAQTQVDQTDLFSRKLSVYARGQLGRHLDYRLVFSDPFPPTSSGSALPPIATHAAFSPIGHHKQYGGYFIWQFLDEEPHLTPYMAGTYLGKRKVFNIAAGFQYQKAASWRQSGTDTAFDDLRNFAVESFLDIPLNAGKGDALSAYAGYFHTDYGRDYLRYNGIMNPASGTSATAQTAITGQGPTFGNALPMFGTGRLVYAQTGYLLPQKFSLGRKGRLQPYASATLAQFDRLEGHSTNTYNAGINCLLSGHRAKVTLDYQNRPTYVLEDGAVVSGPRRDAVTLQYQILF